MIKWLWLLARVVLTIPAVILAAAGGLMAGIYVVAGCWPGAVMAVVLTVIMVGCLRTLWTMKLRELEVC